MDAPLACWRCEQPGHGYRECDRPPAKTETELRDRLARYMELRIAGRISTALKRDWVKSEWKMFNDQKEKARAK